MKTIKTIANFTLQNNNKVVIKKEKLSKLAGALKSSVAFTDLEHELNSTKKIWISKRVKETQ